MNFVKLIRPLFLVALGLHGLALFLPLGDSAEESTVDVAEETSPTEALANGPMASADGELPVPDLNAVASQDVLASKLSAGATSTVPQVLSPRPVTATAKPAATQIFSTTRPTSTTVARPSAVPQSPAASSTVAANQPSASAQPSQSTLPVLAPDNSRSANQPQGSSRLPVLTNPSEGSESSSTSETETSETETAARSLAKMPSSDSFVALDRLMASASGDLPPALKALMEKWAIALTYDPEGTGDRAAQSAQEKWTDKINAQAGGSGLTRLEPEQIENFAKLSYPIESSKRAREQAFRVCLEQPPGPAEIGILFDSQGEPVGEPDMIRSTGYDALNNEIVATLKAAENLPQSRVSKAFIFEVAVDYDEQACASLTELKK